MIRSRSIFEAGGRMFACLTLAATLAGPADCKPLALRGPLYVTPPHEVRYFQCAAHFLARAYWFEKQNGNAARGHMMRTYAARLFISGLGSDASLVPQHWDDRYGPAFSLTSDGNPRSPGSGGFDHMTGFAERGGLPDHETDAPSQNCRSLLREIS